MAGTTILTSKPALVNSPTADATEFSDRRFNRRIFEGVLASEGLEIPGGKRGLLGRRLGVKRDCLKKFRPFTEYGGGVDLGLIHTVDFERLVVTKTDFSSDDRDGTVAGAYVQDAGL